MNVDNKSSLCAEGIPNPFTDHRLRSFYDRAAEKWWFSAVDICAMLTGKDFDAARKYWKTQKYKLRQNGFQLVTKSNQLKFPAANGKYYFTDVFDAAGVAILIQITQSSSAIPFKMWLAQLVVRHTNFETLLAKVGAKDAMEILKHSDTSDAPYELQTITREDIPLQ